VLAKVVLFFALIGVGITFAAWCLLLMAVWVDR
jgi:hypothetical protein